MNNDLISREALKKALEEYKYCGFYDKLIELIDNAPTVKPYCYFCGQKEHGQTVERPQGEWIVKSNGTTHYYACDKCGSAGDIQDKFCRECGADMRGTTNG